VRVLLVSGSLAPLPCGVGDYTLCLAHALAATPGVEVGVLTSRGAALDDTEAVHVFPLMRRWGLAELRTLRSVIVEWAPDILHVQYPTQGYGYGLLAPLVPIIASGLGVKVVRTWHEVPSLLGVPNFLLEALAPGPYIVVRPGFLQRLQPFLRPLLANRAGGYVMGASSIPRSVASETQRRALRKRLLGGKRRLIVFFGFLYPFKRVELLFEIANPVSDRIVIAGEAGVDRRYCESLEQLANEEPWRDSVTMTGFLSNEDTADLLAAADAVVLPFRKGGGVWNSSIHAAVIQGSAVITTSREAPGPDERRNIYFASPDRVPEMRAALDRLAGRRRSFDPDIDRDEWLRIAEQHLALYKARSNARHLGDGYS
jgi:glycosyltransferase involved in cell wall biosynthesis